MKFIEVVGVPGTKKELFAEDMVLCNDASRAWSTINEIRERKSRSTESGLVRVKRAVFKTDTQKSYRIAAGKAALVERGKRLCWNNEERWNPFLNALLSERPGCSSVAAWKLTETFQLGLEYFSCEEEAGLNGQVLMPKGILHAIVTTAVNAQYSNAWLRAAISALPFKVSVMLRLECLWDDNLINKKRNSLSLMKQVHTELHGNAFNYTEKVKTMQDEVEDLLKSNQNTQKVLLDWNPRGGRREERISQEHLSEAMSKLQSLL